MVDSGSGVNGVVDLVGCVEERDLRNQKSGMEMMSSNPAELWEDASGKTVTHAKHTESTMMRMHRRRCHGRQNTAAKLRKTGTIIVKHNTPNYTS